jgi:CubicO group peptidase (beta-lactamase class C family)
MIHKSDNHSLIFQSGKFWSYSNIGYYHLRILIKKTCNLSLNEALDTLIFKPLDITDVMLANKKEDLNQCHYVRENYHPNWLSHGMIIGSLISAYLFLNHLSQGNIINDKSLKIMQELYELNFDIGDRPWEKPAYALGLMIDNRSDDKYSYGHTGMGPDSVIAVYHFPKLNPAQTLAVIMNTEDQGLVEHKVHQLID